MSNFKKWCELWEDTPEVHTKIFRDFNQLVNDNAELKKHRDFIEENEFGYGDRPYHYMWNLLIDSIEKESLKFLEIGVYQGQVLSLVSMLSILCENNFNEIDIYGITPLSPSDDAFSKHADINYEERIGILFHHFGNVEHLTLIQGLSNDPKIIEYAQQNLYDLDILYVDGNHNYDVVVSDIENYTPLLKSSGYLVMDDSANYLNIASGTIRMDWKGILDVSNAVRDKLENNPQFKHVFSVGHNRVWQKL